MVNPAVRVNWIERAFRLAFFIQRNRPAARMIAARAINKLDVTAVAQDKRLYYQPTGRGDTRKSRNKVTVGELLLLQRLVFVESEFFEREREHLGELTTRDAIVHYIKHLIRITSRRNSFYVTLGLCRLLYGYTTAETTEVHALVSQDPERTHDDYYYRSRKALLLKELQARFDGLLRTHKGPRGEEKLETHADSARFAELVAEALRWFAPWDTGSAVPETFDPRNDVLPALTFDGADPDKEHRIEVNRIHAVIHPDDFNRLIRGLGFPAPAERLDVPKFAQASREENDDSRMNPPDPDDEDWEEIEAWLLNESGRRRLSPSGVLRVCVDGEEKARFSPERTRTVNFTVPEGAEMIEIRTRDARGDLTVAMLPLTFEETATARRHAITIESGRRFVFDVQYPGESTTGEAAAEINLTYLPHPETANMRATAWLKSLIFGNSVETGPFVPTWARLATAGLALAFFFMAFWFVLRPTPTPNFVRQPTPEPLRNSTSPPRPEEKTAVVTPEKDQPPTPAPPDETVARVLIREPRSDEPDEGTRAWNPETMGIPFEKVRSAFVEVSGPNREEITRTLRAELGHSRIRLTTDRENADAALKVTVRAEKGQGGRVMAMVRLVNSQGVVVWPRVARAAGWRYTGSPVALARRIATDLKRERR